MKKLLLFLIIINFNALAAKATVVKSVDIEGQSYMCRPASLEPNCSLDGDIGFLVSIAADSADAYACLGTVNTSSI